MPELFGLGEELESIMAGVLGFLAAGVLMFFVCFVVSKLYIWYRVRQLRKKRQKEGRDVEDIGDFADDIVDGD